MCAPRHALVAFAFALVAVAGARTRSAHAQTVPHDTEPPNSNPEAPKPGEPASPGDLDPTPPLAFIPEPDNFMDPRMRRSWDAGPSRAFVSTTVDIGWLYLRPRLSVGYGKPFTSWIGFDVNPTVQAEGFGGYGGVRLSFPYVDLRVGSRYFRAFQRGYLSPQPSYTRLDLESARGELSELITHEAELTLTIPAGPGDIQLIGSASIVGSVPAGKFVFEPTLRTIVDPPYVWRARVGYMLRFGSGQQHSVGVVAEAIDVPKRDDSRTVRAGPLMRFVLSRRVEVRGSFVVTVWSPDQLGLAGGDFTELGVRYRWATE